MVGVPPEGPDCVGMFPEPPQPDAITGSNPAKSAQFQQTAHQSFSRYDGPLSNQGGDAAACFTIQSFLAANSLAALS
jgi:hypothetical protein